MSAIKIDEDEIVSFLKNENDENENENDNDGYGDDRQSPQQQQSSSSSSSHHNHHHHHHHHQLLSDLEVGISLAKAIMGAGSFSLPWAFKNMGYIGGPIALCILMFMSISSMKLLIDCNSNNNNTTNNNNNNNNQSSYVALASSIYGNIGAKLTYIASISASIGVCGSYLVFVAANLQSLTDQWFLSSGYYNNNDNDDESKQSTSSLLSQTTWIIIITPIAIGLSSIRNMKRFAFASLLGDIAVVLGMVVVIVYAIGYSNNNNAPKHTTTDDERVVAAFGTSYSTMALSFGSIGYLFLIHFLVLPIQSNMLNKQNFNYVVNLTFLICAIISGTFGVIGYLYFGSETKQIVLLNIKANENENENQSSSMMFVQIVQLLLCVDLLFTYPVVMRPSIVILLQQQKQKQKQHSTTTRQQQYTYYGICIFLGIIAAGCSALVPAFGVLSGFVGGVSQTFLAFVLPPLMYMKTRKKFNINNNNNNNNKKQQQQQQKRGSGGIINNNFFLRFLFHDNDNNNNNINNNKSPLGLVVMGIILILWTLGSTWNEIMSSSTTTLSSSSSL